MVGSVGSWQEYKIISTGEAWFKNQFFVDLMASQALDDPGQATPSQLQALELSLSMVCSAVKAGTWQGYARIPLR